MQRFSEIHIINLDHLPQELIDSSRFINIYYISDFQVFDRVYPVWETNDSGGLLNYTTDSIGAKSRIDLENNKHLYTDTDSCILRYDLFTYDIWIDASADICSSCGEKYQEFNQDASVWECPNCGHINEPWHYGIDSSYDPETCKLVFRTPFVESSFINVDFLPDNFSKTGTMFINRNSVVDYEWYNDSSGGEPIRRNPLVTFVNNRGVQQTIRPQQIGAGTRMILKGGKSIFTPYSKTEFEGLFDFDSDYVD